MSVETRADSAGLSRVTADPQLRTQLASLGGAEVGGQNSADTLLARIAWSRIAEPGDGVAGALVTALGPAPALGLLVGGATPARLRTAAAEAGVELASQTVTAAVARWRPRLDRAETIGDIERGIASGLRVCTPEDEHWPQALDDLGEHAPFLLWVRGDVEHLSSRSLSVVGARAATGYGTHVTAEIVDGVCAAGFTIVSGAAYGIDAVAHRTALSSGAPTVAVLAGGADRPYPGAHDSLLGRVSEAGAVCAEMIPGAAPTRWRFLMRNRIIAALSSATLVTEAGMRSGSLNTAGHAAELGRALGAVPGPVTSVASAGCHTLIREYGAALITNAREACELTGYAIEPARHTAELGGADTAADDARQPSVHGRVLDALPLRGTRAASEVARRAGLSVGEVMRVLAELELLEQVVRREPTGAAEPEWALQRRQ